MKSNFEIFQNISTFISIEFEPVGKWFEQYNFLKHQGDLNIEHVQDSESSSEDEDILDEEETPEYLKYLETLDPKDWKNQDHYKVLGLETLRYKATQHQIKRAHKIKVLKHHPDKQKQNGSKERDYFTCITKAFENLSNSVKRISYDSVDPAFDDNVPSANDNSKKKFYKVFGEAFERNERWSIKKNVPKLGDETITFEKLNDFYSFWYDFDSWREFSYLDEESKESAQDRDERRWIDKQNKAARAKRKKEEVTRIRQLVDNAYACDPRIAKFKQEEKKKKEDEKNKKREAAKKREEEQLKLIEQARLEKEKLEELEKIRIEAEKKEKEQQKKILKKERKTLRNTVKEYDYFSKDDTERIALMDKIEQLIENLCLSEIQSINENISKSNDKKATAQNLLLNLQTTSETKSSNDIKMSESASEKIIAEQENISVNEWCDDEIRLLVKGVKIIASGTRDRWEVIANFIEEHSRGKFKRTGKEVLTKTKDMQKLDPSVKEEANKKAFEKTLQTIKNDGNVQDKPSERYITPAEQFLVEQGSNLAVWSTEEQKVLEQALKTYPATLVDRWEKISECLPSRSKKDCIVRYKELVELIQAKKRAQQKSNK